MTPAQRKRLQGIDARVNAILAAEKRGDTIAQAEAIDAFDATIIADVQWMISMIRARRESAPTIAKEDAQ